MQEAKKSLTAYFVTLTYDTLNVPITKRGFLTLKKVSDKIPKNEGESKSEYRSRCAKTKEEDNSLQGFFKRLRYYEKQNKFISLEVSDYIRRGGNPDILKNPIKYYACGEYGTKKRRPHYHIIVFNINNIDNIYKAWKFGTIHVDEVNNNTIDYTLKYMLKESSIYKKGFDGLKEFSIMSHGIGEGYIQTSNNEIQRYYQKRLDINYLITDKVFKIPMPKYYRDKILDKTLKDKQIVIIKKAIDDLEKERIEKQLKVGLNPEEQRLKAIKARSEKLKRGQNNRSLE